MTTFTSELTGTVRSGLRLRLPLAKWIRVARERRQLAGLNERQLRDIGVDAENAAAEAARPFWDVPAGR